MELRFYYDVVCPYAYLASTKIEALARRTGAQLIWKPVLLGGIFRTIKRQKAPMEAMNQARARLNLIDMHRWADWWACPLHLPSAHPRRTVSAMRLLCAVSDVQRPALSHRLFRAYWVEGLDVGQQAVLEQLASEFGLSIDCVAQRQIKERLFENTAGATNHGAFGVPAFVVDGQLWWGQDRLHLVERALGGDRQIPWAGLAAHPGATIEFFHDFASPFSYLAATQIEALGEAIGATVVSRPMLLGALFRTLGTADVPLFEMTSQKRAYMGKDLRDWADYWDVPFRFPDHFPLRTVTALRVALAAPETTRVLYDAVWRDNQPIDHDGILEKVLAFGGFDAPALMSAAQSQAIKAALRANTEAAVNAGACGAPSFVVRGAGHSKPLLFWGQDRLNMVAKAASGWRPFSHSPDDGYHANTDSRP